MKIKLAIALMFATVLGAGLSTARADDQVVHIGFQKYGKLVLLKSKGTLEAKLKALGVAVEWREFPSGPPLLEAINAGAIDFGNATGARTLADGSGVVANTQFYLGARKFVEANAQVLDVVLTQLREVDTWAKGDIAAVAAQLSPSIGIPAPVLEVALKRQAYGIKPIDDAVIAEQQKIADVFKQLGILPRAIKVSDAKAGS